MVPTGPCLQFIARCFPDSSMIHVGFMCDIHFAVENIAFKKETWLNNERHNKRALGAGVDSELNQKLAEKAVDGLTENDINSCTILDNYYDDKPQLTIDLGSRHDVSGIIVYMWHGHNDGK